MTTTPTYRPIVEAILEALPDVKVPKGMDVGLKFTSPTQTTHGSFPWPDPGEWTVDFGEDWDPTPCAGGGVHAATTIAAAQSGGNRYTDAMLVTWRPSEAATSPYEPGKVKARRIKTLCRIDMRALLVFNMSGADLSGADLSRADLSRANLTGANLSRADLTGADADKWTRWPEGFDPAAKGVEVVA
jgi:hypothetical protein